MAKKFSAVGGAAVTLWEYQSFATTEFPDVLILRNTGSTLYEIKMSHSDFIADSRKESRIRYSTKLWSSLHTQMEKLREDNRKGYLKIGKRIVHELQKIETVIHSELKKFRIEIPHLGNQRWFVCPEEVIQVSELPLGWGLIWYKEGKFFQKRRSENFRSNLKDEKNLLIHALRKWVSGYQEHIIVTKYGKPEGKNLYSETEEESM